MATQDVLLQGIIDAIDALQANQSYWNPRVSLTAFITSKSSSTTSAPMLPVNSLRRGVIIVNSDANDLYIRYGATASTSANGWTYKIPSGATWEMPLPAFGGRIDGIWTAAGSGVAEITEY